VIIYADLEAPSSASRRLNSSPAQTPGPALCVLPPPNLSEFRANWKKNPNSLASILRTLSKFVSANPCLSLLRKLPGVFQNPFWNPSRNLQMKLHSRSEMRPPDISGIPWALQPSNAPLASRMGLRTFQCSNDLSTYPFFHILPHSFALFAASENSTSFFSNSSTLFTQKHPGVGRNTLNSSAKTRQRQWEASRFSPRPNALLPRFLYVLC